ncbi:baculoviral IAP repeat-containing protein 3-like [Tetranychus urticae]|uniref:RING-type domain-containing protein n=1 Tax=Tetranychus urticae TaxID=32264 RepID=T1L5D8_TETUR|nr:baculoviral IAP repeat-containing protein 3-like [Tetranychus urticae]XP_025018276.1 baculoviral IAP repeat-containing protein 3-like [Tetranychus urticae]
MSLDRTQLLQESVRLQTFYSMLGQSWTACYRDFEELAAFGFYHTSAPRTVACIFCSYRNYISSVPRILLTLHNVQSPSCPAIRGEAVGNRHIPTYLSTHVDVVNDYVRFSSEVDINTRLNNLKIKANRHQHKMPFNKTMSSEETRRFSFISWPHTEMIPHKELAKAGFYYTGDSDTTRCFHCGGILSSWKKNTNVWSVHAYYFPHCHYLYLKRGAIFVDSVKSPNQKTCVVNELPEPSEDLRRYRCMICMCKEIGISFQPCDHLISCIDCGEKLSKCPICRTDITAKFRQNLP